MAYAIKEKQRVQAWELGTGSETEREMIRLGKIVRRADGNYELFSQEATEGKGEIARPGDFFKVDNKGFPYPNERAFFLQNHQPLEDDWYLQTARPLLIWRRGDPPGAEMRFLLDQGILSLHPEDPRRYFSAFLWGTTETAADDAVIVFFEVRRDAQGSIEAINFNFVESEYFRMHYRVLPE